MKAIKSSLRKFALAIINIINRIVDYLQKEEPEKKAKRLEQERITKEACDSMTIKDYLTVWTYCLYIIFWILLIIFGSAGLLMAIFK